MSSHKILDRNLLLRWVRATWAGWLLGIPFIIILALIGEAVGIGGSQFLVGAGMGTGTGLLQSRVLRGVTQNALPWFWSSAVGLGIPFLVADISNVAGWGIEYSLSMFVAFGGVMAGAWQAFILRSHFRKAWLWVVASVLGWTLAALGAHLSQHISRSNSLRGILGALIYLSIVAAGGLILGSITGVCLAWMALTQARA
jgi:hypothetical protein